MLTRRKFIKKTTLTSGVLLGSSLVFGEERKNSIRPPENLFMHGVASGDILSSQVIIWTRLSTTENGSPVKWIIAKDKDFLKIDKSGQATASAENDYTIKIDVTGLEAATIYYYQFFSGNVKSPTGRTKTAPDDGHQNIQFAVVSCSDYTAGYYNALAKIAGRKDLDAVIHLGDYIYEGTERTFDPQHKTTDDEYENTHFNRTRQWWLHYYRRRYALNRLDPDLQAAHHMHPFITVWDDHEIANNAWKDGAQGHNPEKDGDWSTRKSAAKQAYAEWVPVRGNAEKIYRSIRFGKLAELILLDTRLEGRDQQIYNSSDPAILAPGRSILGQEQKQWLFSKLDNSPCQWKLIANQVIFSEINIKWAAIGGHFRDKVTMLENTLLDYWEGYPAERDEVINHLGKNKINDVVILSASMHCALAFDVTARATNQSRAGEKPTYDATTGKGAVAVEFAATSITSANFDEKMGSFYANTFQSLINKKLPPSFGGYNPNPHLKFADLQKHGYFVLSVGKEKAEASFYFVTDLVKRGTGEELGGSWYTKSGNNKLEKGLNRAT